MWDRIWPFYPPKTKVWELCYHVHYYSEQRFITALFCFVSINIIVSKLIALKFFCIKTTKNLFSSQFLANIYILKFAFAIIYHFNPFYPWIQSISSKKTKYWTCYSYVNSYFLIVCQYTIIVNIHSLNVINSTTDGSRVEGFYDRMLTACTEGHHVDQPLIYYFKLKNM